LKKKKKKNKYKIIKNIYTPIYNVSLGFTDLNNNEINDFSSPFSLNNNNFSLNFSDYKLAYKQKLKKSKKKFKYFKKNRKV